MRESTLVLFLLATCLTGVVSAQSGSRGSGYRPSSPRITRPATPRGPITTRGSSSRPTGPRSFAPQNSINLQGTSGSYAPVNRGSTLSRPMTNGSGSRSSGTRRRRSSSSHIHSGVSDSMVFTGTDARVWWDNTGTYSFSATLKEVRSQSVRLETPQGKTATVDWRRLSVADQQYARQQIAMLKRRNAAAKAQD